jgi:hypothetical protein
LPAAGSPLDTQSSPPKGNSGGRIPVSFSSLLSQLKLPVDSLSASIVSFAQFFSLPLNPALLANIRRQTISGSSDPGAPLPGGHAGGIAGENSGPASREALSLACIAALDKGVELSAESLARYARMISGRNPPAPVDADGKGDAGENQEAGPGPDNDNFPADGEAGQSSGGGESPEGGRSHGRSLSKSHGRSPSGNGDGSPETLRELALQAEAGTPLLGLLNRLPGKNGKRWLVIPIPLEDGGTRFPVTLRLLFSPCTGVSAGMPGEVEQMSLEINGDRRRWLFSYRPGSILQAALWPETEPGERAGLEQELAVSLGLSPGQVRITGWDPLFAPDCRNDLFSVREEV